ncbi:MAG: hypothetical protein WAS34_18900 [Thiolinea sp.]
MALRKFEFCIATNKIGSECKDIVEIEIEDDLTEDKVNDIVDEIYTEWLFEHNNGWCKEITK